MSVRKPRILLAGTLISFFVLSPLSAYADEAAPIPEQTPVVESSPAPADTPAPEQSTTGGDSTTEDTTTPLSTQSGTGSNPALNGQFVADRSAAILPETDESTGALIYRYPLSLPAGRNGMRPDLSLTYNNQQVSQTPNIIGYGWSVSIPYIERINRTGSDQLYTAGYFNSSLSGELVQIGSGSYAPKIETGDFLKYVLSGGYWLVTDKQGTTYRFGQTVASRQDDTTGTKVYRWMLDRITDTNGNYISYEYYKDAGQIYPNRITYTGNGADAGPFEVLFTRAARSDVDTLYATGFAVTTSYKITQVQVSVSGQWVRRYDLTYGAGNNGRRLLLTGITESGRDALGTVTTLPPVQLEYTVPATGWSEGQGTPYDDFKDFKMLGDANGDGLLDTSYFYIDSNNITHKGTYQYLVNGSEGFSAVSGFVPPVLFDAGSNAQIRDQGVRLNDINGDFKADLYKYFYDNFNGPAANVYINDGTAWNASSSWMPNVPIVDTRLGPVRQSQIFDANGDGLADVFQTWRDSNCGSSGNGNFNTGSGWRDSAFFPATSFADGGVMVMDVNGDGLNDLVQGVQAIGGCIPVDVKKVYINTGTSWVYDPSWVMPVFAAVGSGGLDNGARSADVNGDGLTDLLISNECGAFDTYLNNGAGWAISVAWRPPTTFAACQQPNGDLGARILDLNGDGMPDVSWPVRAMINNGQLADLLKKITFPAGGNATVTYQPSHRYRDGSNNLLSPQLPFVVNTVKQIDLSDANGTTKTDSYSYEGGKYYFAGALNRRFSGFGKVIHTDSTGDKSITYYHQGDSSDASIGETGDIYGKIGRPFRIDQLDPSGNLQKRTWNTWTNFDQGSGRSYVYLSGTEDQAYDGNSGHKDRAVSYVRDTTNGNVTQQTDWGEVIGSGTDSTYTDTGTDKYITAYTYATNGSGRYAPSDVTKTDQSGTRVSETRNYYDLLPLGQLDKGNPTKQEQAKDATTYINTTKTYNAYGLVTHETDPRGNPTDYVYDANNLYPATVTNAAGQVWQYTYDYQTGKPLTTVTPNNVSYASSYDGLCRTTLEQIPDPATGSLVTKTGYVYADTSGAVSIRRTDWLDSTNGVDSYQYLDGLGRPVQTKKETENTNWTTTDTVYDTNGRLWKQSLPYFTTSNLKSSATADGTLYKVYSYDSLSRITQEATAVGNTGIAYDDWKKTITDPRGNSKIYYSDAYDRLNRVDELNGVSTYITQYGYDGLGDLTQITDALGNVRNFGYDLLGRRTSAQDLHAPADSTFGTYSYGYDDAGNLTSKLTPNNQTINYGYDSLNRVTSEDFTGQAGTEATYTYDTCPNGKGMLCSVLSAGASVSQEFDPAGNIKRERKKINGITYQADYTADRQANPLTITNPDLSQVAYAYNAGGQLETVQRKESIDGSFITVVSNFDYGPHGQITSQSDTNGSVTTNTYDPLKVYRLSAKLTTAGGKRVQDSAYSYDANNNITRIVDNSQTLAKKTVDYTYDALNRLTSAISTGASNSQDFSLTFGYSALGNITSKSDQGLYTYAGDQGSSYANPHAVTSVSGAGANTFSYDNNGNLTGETGKTYIYDYNNRLVQAPGSGNSVTVTFSPIAGDGSVYYSNSNSWATTHDTATGTGAGYTGTTFNVNSGKYNNTKYKIERAFLPFDTSSLPDNATISSVKLKAYVDSKLNDDNDGTDWVTVVQSTQPSTTSLVTSDYSKDGAATNPTEGIDTVERKDITGVATGAYLIFNLNSTGRGWVSLTGPTKLGLREGHDATNTAFVGNSGQYDQLTIRSGEYTGTSSDPILEVTYSVPSVISYAYDASGQRTSYSNGATTTSYPSKYFNTDGTIPTKHIYAGDLLVADVVGSNASASVHYVHDDHLSGSNVVTDQAGSLQETLDYYPYGSIRLDNKTGSFSEQKKFTGYEYDADTGLNYANARYQDGKQGRFVSQDPSFLAIGDGAKIKQLTGRDLQAYLMDPQELNSYAYARNNPITKTDPTGNASLFATLFNPLVSFFKLAALGAEIFGRPATAELLARSASLNPSSTYNATDGSKVVNAIQAASEYQNKINSLLQDQISQGNKSFSEKSVNLSFESGDAQTALHKMDLSISGTMQKNGDWNISVAGSDKYDFDADHKSGDGIVGTAANAAYHGQQTQALTTYTTVVKFQQTIKSQTPKKGK